MGVVRCLSCLKRPRTEDHTPGSKESRRECSFPPDYVGRKLFTPQQQQHPTSKARKYHQDMSSPFGWIEELFTEDTWRLLICIIFLKRTQRKTIDGTLHRCLLRWHNADDVLYYASKDDSLNEMIQIVAPLGLTYKRARGIVRFYTDFKATIEAKEGEDPDSSPAAFTLNREEVTNTSFCGDYAADAYQIFIRKDFQSPVESVDRALLAYTD